MTSSTNNGVVLSLYDFTGISMEPWAEAGYRCICLDIKHQDSVTHYTSGGSIEFRKADLHDAATIEALKRQRDVVFVCAFPVCTDMAVSGAAWFKSKLAKDSDVQIRAANHARAAAGVGDALRCPYYVENPVSVLSTLWRKPDYRFHPYQYGGYIPTDRHAHPSWPRYIAARDAYPKKTCLWVGGGFTMPPFKPVLVSAGHSAQHKLLGGKSERTKSIRSATPRGFSRAVFLHNS